MIPSSCHADDDLCSVEHNTWNAAHALNHIHNFISFGSSSASWTPPNPSAPKSYRKWQYPAGQQSIRRMPGRSSHRKRKSPYMFSPEIWRDDTHVTDCQRETERDLKSQSVWLINAQRIYNICRSQEQRILGNSGCSEVESQTGDQILIAGHSFSVTKAMNHPDKCSQWSSSYERWGYAVKVGVSASGLGSWEERGNPFITNEPPLETNNSVWYLDRRLIISLHHSLTLLIHSATLKYVTFKEHNFSI